MPPQDLEAKAKTAKEHAEGKPSSETLNKAKVKVKRHARLDFFYLSSPYACGLLNEMNRRFMMSYRK